MHPFKVGDEIPRQVIKTLFTIQRLRAHESESPPFVQKGDYVLLTPKDETDARYLAYVSLGGTFCIRRDFTALHQWFREGPISVSAIAAAGLVVYTITIDNKFPLVGPGTTKVAGKDTSSRMLNTGLYYVSIGDECTTIHENRLRLVYEYGHIIGIRPLEEYGGRLSADTQISVKWMQPLDALYPFLTLSTLPVLESILEEMTPSELQLECALMENVAPITRLMHILAAVEKNPVVCTRGLTRDWIHQDILPYLEQQQLKQERRRQENQLAAQTKWDRIKHTADREAWVQNAVYPEDLDLPAEVAANDTAEVPVLAPPTPSEGRSRYSDVPLTAPTYTAYYDPDIPPDQSTGRTRR